MGNSAGFADLSPQKIRITFAVRLVEKGATPAALTYAMGYEPHTEGEVPEFAELANLMAGD